jgi:hypothetical protein
MAVEFLSCGLCGCSERPAAFKLLTFAKIKPKA